MTEKTAEDMSQLERFQAGIALPEDTAEGLYSADAETQPHSLRVWWMPQVPMPAFYVSVCDVDQAAFLLNTLGYYDLFQLEYKIKPDYSNMGGLEVFENGEWTEWESADGDDINSLRREGKLPRDPA